MKKALHSLMTACALTSVSVAQIHDIERQNSKVRNDSVFSKSANRAAGTTGWETFGNTITGRALIPGADSFAERFRHTITIADQAPGRLLNDEPKRTAHHEAFLDGLEAAQIAELEFELPGLPDADPFSGSMDEADEHSGFLQVIEYLETGSPRDFAPRGSRAIVDGKDASLPEPQTYGLIGMMALLSIVVARTIGRMEG